jgi:hypothetical protein
MRVLTVKPKGKAAKSLEPVTGEAARLETENWAEIVCLGQRLPVTAGGLDCATVAIEGLLSNSLLEECEYEVVMRALTVTPKGGAAKTLEPVAGEAAKTETEDGAEMMCLGQRLSAIAGELDFSTVAIGGLLTKSLLEE